MLPQTMYLLGKQRREDLMREARAIHLAERFEPTSLKSMFRWLRSLCRPLLLRFPQPAANDERP